MLDNSQGSNKKPKKQMSKKSNQKTVLIILVVVLLLIGGIVIGGYTYAKNILDNVNKVEVNEENLAIDKEIEKRLSQFEDIQNIALFGVDALDGENGRSDSIMILTIDRKNKEFRLSSIMRDSYVKIDKHGTDKINHAYAFGGPELAIKTINQNYDLNIKDFVSVDFSTLPKIIDLLGGLELDVKKEEINSKLGINSHINHLNVVTGSNSPNITEPGVQHLDGIQSLAYTRIRYTSGGDEERTHRHQIVFNKLLEKFEALSPSQYPGMLKELFPLVQTSLSSDYILSLAIDVFRMGKIDLRTSTFPKIDDAEDVMIDDIYYLKFDKTNTVEKLHRFMFEGIEEDNTKNNN